MRLKGGDPFLFGRGGEEAEALADAECAFEIVPGVTSAIAGPAYAGIPVTHRSHNAVLTISPATKSRANRNPLWTIRRSPASRHEGHADGCRELKAIAGELQTAGMPSRTPVTLVRWATTGAQQTLAGTLENIAERAQETGFKPPAVAVFGEVVALREKLNWFETLSLFGKRIAVTRTRKQAGEFVERLRALGADAFEMPTIRIQPPAEQAGVVELVADSHIYDWIVFTSPNGVDAFFKAFFEIYRDARDIGGARIAAIGPATCKARAQLPAASRCAAGEIRRRSNHQGPAKGDQRGEPQISSRPCRGGSRGPGGRTHASWRIVDEAVAYRTVPETNDVTGGIRRFREEGADMIAFPGLPPSKTSWR